MTETEWLTCADPQKMLEFLQENASDRKLQLFACACCRRLWHLLPEDRHRQAVTVVEQYADGLLLKEDVMQARGATSYPPDDDNFAANTVYTLTAAGSPYTKPYMARVADYACYASAWDGNEVNRQIEKHEKMAQVHLLRCIFGKPVHHVGVDPSWLAWKEGTVVGLAQTAYEERHLPAGTLDNGRLAILADALEEAGCTDGDILAHCRLPGEHVRGCWVLDLLLGKS